MKIYCAHSSGFDFLQNFYKPFQECRELESHDLIFPHLPGHQIKNSRDMIRSCDLVLAEVSYPSTGMGIELGWANAYNVPVLAVYNINAKPSESIRMIAHEIHGYSQDQELIGHLTRYLNLQDNKGPHFSRSGGLREPRNP